MLLVYLTRISFHMLSVQLTLEDVCQSSVCKNVMYVFHLLQHQVKSVDGVEVKFQPLSLPENTEVSIIPKSGQDLNCSLTDPKTRFKPLGYKEVAADPPQDPLLFPMKVSWQIPERYKSLDKIKFLTLPSPGAVL